MLTTVTRRLAATTAARHTPLSYSAVGSRVKGVGPEGARGCRRARSTWASLAQADQNEHADAVERGVNTVVTFKMCMGESPAPQAVTANPREPLEHAEMKEWSRSASKTMARAANLGRENLSQLLPVVEHQKVLLELIEQQFALMDTLQTKLDDAVYLRTENEQLQTDHALEIRRMKLAHAAELQGARCYEASPAPGDDAIAPSLARLQRQMALDRTSPQQAATISDITFGPLRL